MSPPNCKLVIVRNNKILNTAINNNGLVRAFSFYLPPSLNDVIRGICALTSLTLLQLTVALKNRPVATVPTVNNFLISKAKKNH